MRRQVPPASPPTGRGKCIMRLLLARLSQVEGQAKVLEARVEALAREVREDSKAWTKDCKMAGEELMRLLTTVDGIQVKTAEVKSRKKELSTRLIKAMDMNENNVESRKKEEGRKEGGRRKEKDGPLIKAGP